MKKTHFLLIPLATILFSACSVKTSDTLSTTPTMAPNTATEGTTMEQTMQPEITELIVNDTTVGSGVVAEAGDTVTVHYTGTFLDGAKFDSSKDRGTPFSFELGAGMVIEGWDVGVEGMKVGGTRELTIPYMMAYGERGFPGAIPPKSPLHFVVELLDVEKAK